MYQCTRRSTRLRTTGTLPKRLSFVACHVLQVHQLQEAQKSVQLEIENGRLVPNGVGGAVSTETAVDTHERDVSDSSQTTQESKVSSEGETMMSLSERREASFLTIVKCFWARGLALTGRSRDESRTLIRLTICIRVQTP